MEERTKPLLRPSWINRKGGVLYQHIYQIRIAKWLQHANARPFGETSNISSNSRETTGWSSAGLMSLYIVAV